MSSIQHILNISFYIILLTIITFMWFKIQSLESYIFMISDSITKKSHHHHKPPSQPSTAPQQCPSTNIDEFNMADILMNEVFCNSSRCQPSTDIPIIHHFENCKSEDIDIQEIKEVEKDVVKEIEKKDVKEDIVEIFDLKKDDDEKKSIISDTTLSKTRLSKLNLDKLKEKCIELNISTDGSKNQLIERILSQSS